MLHYIKKVATELTQFSMQAGMNAHLSKPVEPDRLFRTLEELICEADESLKKDL